MATSIPTIITLAQAGALAAIAAMRLGCSVSVWTGADATTQQAAIDAATADLFAEPGLHIYDRETDSAVQLAATVQALYLLDLQGDGNAQERRRLQDQGVAEVQQGRNREQYRRGRRSGVCAAAKQLLGGYRGAVRLS